MTPSLQGALACGLVASLACGTHGVAVTGLGGGGWGGSVTGVKGCEIRKRRKRKHITLIHHQLIPQIPQSLQGIQLNLLNVWFLTD